MKKNDWYDKKEWSVLTWNWRCKEYRKGWRLYLCIGNSNNPVDGVWFKTVEDLKKCLPKNKTVFVHLDDTKNKRSK